MADHFSWLHLTDLHYGQPGQSHRWPNIRQAFFEDLARLHSRCGPWQAVIFTGDLVFSSQAKQFQDMKSEVLDRLYEKLDKLGSANPVLLAVPGNHDLERPTEKNATLLQLLRDGGFSEIADDFWTKPDCEYRQIITKVFSSFSDWWDNVSYRPQENFRVGILPGDYSATVTTVGEQRIGIIGLNSTFLQLSEGNFQERLVVDSRQLSPVCGDLIDWLETHDACLLLTHHGYEWLSKEAQDEYSEINPAGRFVAHLFGHMHEHKQALW